ncbi:MAG: hypothetical protein E6J89_11210 [Deltaproteobacteria bacterium]|nr:MAG: hypothetical protein E6J89_11210 [Deltaproteobacteria bacterium]
MKFSRGEERAYLPGTHAFIVSSLFLALIGCTNIVSPDKNLPEPIPSISRDPSELVKGLAQRLEQFRSLRALASVSYSGRDGKGSFQEAVVVRRPDRLRLETLSPLGAILIVTVNGQEIIGFHPREALFLRGKSSKENLLRYTQVPLELHELTLLLIGLPPVEIHGRWEGEGNSIYRDIGGGRKDAVAFDPALVVPIKWERSRDGGEIELRAIFSDYSSTPAGSFPLKISVEAPAQQRWVEIRYQEPELNATFPSDLFVQEKPGNVKELPIESLGG